MNGKNLEEKNCQNGAINAAEIIRENVTDSISSSTRSLTSKENIGHFAIESREDLSEFNEIRTVSEREWCMVLMCR